MLTPRLSKESARYPHAECWDVRPHLHAHGRRRSDDGDEFVEVLTLWKFDAKMVGPKWCTAADRRYMYDLK